MIYSPDLHPDVARLIFEDAAWADRSTAHSLALVSKDVHQWADPILYHNVDLDTPTRVFAFAASVIARNDPKFFHRTVKVLTIGSLDLEHFPQYKLTKFRLTELDKSLIHVLMTCRGVKRYSYWAPGQIQILRTGWAFLQPTHVSLISAKQFLEWEPNPSIILRRPSPFLTHLHLDFALFAHLDYCHQLGVWPDVFKNSPRLAQLQLSGDAFESLEPQTSRQAIESIVSVLPQTLTRLIVSAMSIRTRMDSARMPVRLKIFQLDPRVVFILPMTHHSLDAVEELQPHEKHGDVYLTREDLHCEDFCSRYLDMASV